MKSEVISKAGFDPLLVGLPEKNVGYAVLYAIWGKDIEDLNEYFGDKQ